MSLGRVALVVPTLGLGGTESHVAALAGALVRDGFDVEVVAIGCGGPVAERVLESGASVHVARLRGATDPRAPAHLLGVFRRLPPTVVHAFLFGFDGVAALPARLAGVPRVLGSRRERASWMRAHHRLMQAAGTSLVDRVVCCSESVRRYALETEAADPERFIVRRNGVDSSRFRPDPRRREAGRKGLDLGPADRAIVTVANFDVVKGHHHLLDALPAIAAAQPRVRLLLAGDGPLRRARQEDCAERPALAARVRFLGRVTDVPGLLAAADVFVLPSLTEGLPNALLEAMASGLPAVATRVGGVPEVVEEGWSGLLVEPGRPQELAAAVLRILGDRELGVRLGHAARERMEREFSLEVALGRHLALYREPFA